MLDTAKTESPAGFRLQSTQCQGHGRGCRKRAGARVALRSPKTGGDNEEASQPLYTPLRTRKHSEANAQRDLNKRRRRKKKIVNTSWSTVSRCIMDTSVGLGLVCASSAPRICLVAIVCTDYESERGCGL